MKILKQIQDEGYEAYFLRGETKDQNPYCETMQEESFDAWEEGRARAEADAE
jgi:hypothetical protein